MSIFLCGVLFGAILAGGGIIIVLQRMSEGRREKEIREWTDQHYQPPVSTKLLIKERTFEL